LPPLPDNRFGTAACRGAEAAAWSLDKPQPSGIVACRSRAGTGSRIGAFEPGNPE